MPLCPSCSSLPQALRSLRTIHTSASRRAPPAQSTSSLISSLFRSGSSPPSSSNRSRDEINARTRDMLSDLHKNRAIVEDVDETRKRFTANTISPPYALTKENLHAPRSPASRPPLLGPPKQVAARIDPFHLTGSNPLDHASNPLFVYGFVNQLGRLKTRAEIGLTRRSQRLVGKMVRRARAMGVISRFSDRQVEGGMGKSTY